MPEQYIKSYGAQREAAYWKFRGINDSFIEEMAFKLSFWGEE